ncbi:MAG: TonB C-terminal domain-containing protein [Sorangiineae bacterium]|nr:TonB C-terminal domain-containing protein [Polyangiaceae bacterium]MEB2322630.1 TonB C-terminal domain-containing protein [Sorangiineae bacterium]
MNDRAASFSRVDIGLAVVGAAIIEAGLFVALAAGGSPAMKIQAMKDVVPVEVPIAVKPVVDDLPLLKLGGKRVHAKLPDMWQKQAPVQQYEAKSAPSPEAKKTPDAIPTSPVATGDAEAPPPDAEIVAKVDPDLTQVEAGAEAATVEGPGAAGGVVEGTETDPLKARAVSQYRMRLIGWFNARFHLAKGAIPCAELETLGSSVTATLGPDGTVAGYTMGAASGNAVFDAAVRSAMDSAKGQQVPPPPPLYPDVLPPALNLHFTKKGQKCE